MRDKAVILLALIAVSSAVLNNDPAVTTRIDDLGIDIQFETDGRKLTQPRTQRLIS